MRCGIIADTHDNVDAVERAVAVFVDEGVDAIIHCGDIIAPPVVPFFDGFEVHAVLGNNDGERDGLERAFADLGTDSELHGRFAELSFDGTRFAVLHGEDLDEVESHAASGDYDYVCYGHHHEVEQRRIGETTIINPGAHFPTVPGEHQCVAIVDTGSDEVQFVTLGNG